ncbi:MAG: hypothetical protein HY327_00385 [Chloroflexi bacterium]|nr:hypothetical protein [Chloroflexota bacterium]
MGDSPRRTRRTRRIPNQSLFYERVLPIILIALALATAAMIVVAAGVLLGFVHYR